MPGWGSWATGLATQAASTVSQFGHDCLDSVTTIDDEERRNGGKAAPPSTAARLLFDADDTTGEDGEPEATAEVLREPSTTTTQAEEGDAKHNNHRSGEQEGLQGQDGATHSGWASKELGFAGARAAAVLALGRTAVETGAGAALQLLPPDEEDDDEQQRKGAAAEEGPGERLDGVAAAPPAGQPRRADPLAALRLAKGERLLQLPTDASAAHRNACEEVLDPIAVGEFSLDDWGEAAATVDHIASLPIGRQLRVAARDQALMIDDSTGEPIAEEGLLAVLDDLPQRAAEVAEAVCEMVVEELASVLLADGEESGGDRDWLHPSQDGTPSRVAPTTAAERIEGTKALLTFAQAEVGRATMDLCDLATSAYQYARRVGHPDLKAIKTKAYDVRGECYVRAAEHFPMLEEAAECAIVIVAASFDPLAAASADQPSEDPPVVVRGSEKSLSEEAKEKNVEVEEDANQVVDPAAALEDAGDELPPQDTVEKEDEVQRDGHAESSVASEQQV